MSSGMDELDRDPTYQLVLERLERFEQTFEAHFKIIEMNVEHLQKLNLQSADTLKLDLISLHNLLTDHETRLRSLTDSMVTWRTWQTILTSGTAIAAITAFLQAFFGK